jgi:hypothetical protein
MIPTKNIRFFYLSSTDTIKIDWHHVDLETIFFWWTDLNQSYQFDCVWVTLCTSSFLIEITFHIFPTNYQRGIHSQVSVISTNILAPFFNNKHM